MYTSLTTRTPWPCDVPVGRCRRGRPREARREGRPGVGDVLKQNIDGGPPVTRGIRPRPASVVICHLPSQTTQQMCYGDSFKKLDARLSTYHQQHSLSLRLLQMSLRLMSEDPYACCFSYQLLGVRAVSMPDF